MENSAKSLGVLFLAALSFAPFVAQAQSITYSDGQDRTDTISSSSTTSLTVSSGTATQSGVISGTGGVRKLGAGTLNFTATNTYTGSTAVSAGTLVFAGSSSGNIGSISVGNTASTTATLNITAGTYAMAGPFYVGESSTATGIVNQSAGSVTLGSAQLLIGEAGTGIYNLSGGTLTTATSTGLGILLGVNSNSHATFNLSGAGILNASNALLLVGRANYNPTINTTVAYNQTGGTAAVGTLLIGGASGVNSSVDATLLITAGTFTANTFSHLAAGNSDTAALTFGGTAQVTLPAFPTTRGSGTTTSIVFDFTNGGGGYLAPSASSSSYMPAGTFTTASLTANGANFNTNSFEITIGQVLRDQTTLGTLTKSGAGTLTLSSANTYTGTTTISSGTLALGASGSIANSSAITVASGATFNVSAVSGGFSLASGQTLGGAGSVVGPITIASGAHLAPGSSPGTLTFSNGLTLNTGSILDFELGTTSDLIRVTGGTLTGPSGTGGITLNLANAGGFAAGTYTLFDFTTGGTTTSNFDVTDFTFGSTISGYTYNLSFGDNTLQLTASAIPEPSTYAALLGACALAFAATRRRKPTS